MGNEVIRVLHCEELDFDAVGISDHAFIPESIRSAYPSSRDIFIDWRLGEYDRGEASA